MEVYKANNNYTSFYNGINNIFTPFVKSDQDVLKIDTINTDLEAIVDNLEDYYSYVYKKGDQIAKRRFFIQRYNLGMTKMSNKVMRSGKSVYMRENINKNDTVCIKSVIMLPKEAIEFSRVSLPGTSILARSSLSHNWMYYFRLLTKKTGFKRIDLESVNAEYNYEAEGRRRNLSGFRDVIQYSKLYKGKLHNIVGNHYSTVGRNYSDVKIQIHWL